MPDVVDLIMEDHREVERLFDKMKSDPDSGRCWSRWCPRC